METVPRGKKHEPVGPIVAIVIIVLLFAIGGVYFFGKRYMEWRALPPEAERAAIE